MSKTFIDTNILVYSMDNNEPGKKEKCRNVFGEQDGLKIGS